MILRERTKSTSVGGHLRHHLEDSEYICTSNHQVLLAQMEEAAGEAEVDHQVKLLLGENSVPMLHPSGGVGGAHHAEHVVTHPGLLSPRTTCRFCFLPHIQPLLRFHLRRYPCPQIRKGPLLCNFFSGSESQNLPRFEIENINT